MLNELSSTVVFERPLEEPFVRKWQLACQGDIAHVVVMPNITLNKLEAFVTDLIASRARHATASIQVPLPCNFHSLCSPLCTASWELLLLILKQLDAINEFSLAICNLKI